MTSTTDRSTEQGTEVAGGAGLYGSRTGLNMAAASTAEFVGTAILVFGGTGVATAATLAEPVAGPAYDSLPTPLAFGLVLLVVVAALGHVFGAHVNPAVTLGLATTGKFPWRYVPAYLVAQLLGALLGALGTWVAFGTPGREQASLAATAPTAGVGALQGLAVEAIVTFVLVFVIIRPVHRQGRRAGLRSGDPDARPREQDEGRTSGSSGARGTRRAPDAVWWSRRQHRQSEADADPRLSPNMRRRRVGFP